MQYPAIIKCLCFFVFQALVVSSFVAQDLRVETILNLNASGGITMGPDGNIYVSDFGPALGTASNNTSVFKVQYGTWQSSVFATGFTGASGSIFDANGNFYQSNPSGARVSKKLNNGGITYSWVTSGMNGGPIGITSDRDGDLYVCVCGTNRVQKVTLSGVSTTFANSGLFNCPNGITSDPADNLYVCNFNDGRILKITPAGQVSILTTFPTFSGIGNGHLTYSNGFLFVTTIGTGQIYKVSLFGQSQLIAGVINGLSNIDGPALQATFSKPNGIIASKTGDTLFVNCSAPTWTSNRNALHPGLLRMVTGVCSLPDVDCSVVTSTNDAHKNLQMVIHDPSPNPARDEIRLNYELNAPQSFVNISVYDASLKEIYKEAIEGKNLGSYEKTIMTSDWPSGVYFAHIRSENFSGVRKFLVE